MTKSNLRKKIRVLHIKAEKALKKAVSNAIKDHQRTGDPVVIWKNGKVMRVAANRLKTA